MVTTEAVVTAQTGATPTSKAVIEMTDGLVECAESAIGSLPAQTVAAAVYGIVSGESAARYRVVEELAQVGEAEAVGETRAIIGQLAFGEDGMPLLCARFDVDLRTLKSDEVKRDNYLYENSLQSEKYPLATFVLRDIEGLDAPLGDGEARNIVLIGNLTLRDVTKLVAWEATVAREGDTITAKAATEFAMSDFAIEPPSVPVVLSVDETVRLEIDVTARPQT
jgi:polyisoprenoid-binding protein YceI